MNVRFSKLLVLIITVVLLYKTFNYLLLSDKEGLNEDIDNIGKIKVSVYYEALCPDSRFFVAYQLLPTFREFNKFIILDLVPYGKAQTIESNSGGIEFDCQHDALECFANKIHSCVIELVKDPLVQLEYITCMIKDNDIPEDAGKMCGKELNINYGEISQCANNIQGSRLLKAYGERTNALNPSITFVPTIEFNGSQNLIAQPQILKDLKKALCVVLNNKPLRCS